MSSKALFLDRDGVINLDHGYVHSIKNFDFIDGIFHLLTHAQEKNYLLIIITNQAGIGRGFYTEKIFKELTSWMCDQFSSKNIFITKVYHCASHPIMGIGSYKKEDFRRKPSPGMILDAKKEFDIDLNASILIGDKETDIKAGIAAGIPCNILYNPDESLSNLDYSVSSLEKIKKYL